tara:strand:+ start:1200 stop:2318 length:1119 start_codon:yes stop_codon:yes gene_type:complete
MALTKITGELIETSPTLSTSITLTSTDAGSSAGPDLILYRNSSSPADADYLGQIQFKGRHDGSGDEIYAKVTGKISDASSGTEDGLIETAVKGNGSFVIVSRQKSDKLQLLNGVDLEVDGDVAIGATTVDPLALSFTGTGLALNEDSGTAFMQIDGGNGSRIDFGISGSRNTTLYADASITELGRTTNHPIAFKTNNTERVRIANDGKVGIGETSPLGKLHVKSGESSGSADANADELVIEGAGNHGIQFLGPNNSYMQMLFGDNDDSDVGYLAYDHTNNALTLGVNAAERFRVDSSGHITPGSDNAQDLGTNSKRWRNVYSADLQLSNVDTGGNDVDGSEGSWTIQEGENDLFIINRKNGKKYKFSLEEIK